MLDTETVRLAYYCLGYLYSLAILKREAGATDALLNRFTLLSLDEN
ncbi:MAG: hypothetical protein NVS2B12_41790 [Ktedonobacteraceae bacterium]